MKLRRIIGQFLSSADQSSHQFLKLWNIAKWGLDTEFNLDILGTIKTVILDVNGNKTVTLPCDYIRYLKIGQINGNGEVVTLKRNDQLSTLNHGGDDRFKGAPVIGSTSDFLFDPLNWQYYNNYYSNGTMYKFYGADSGTLNRGEYKVDDANKTIFLSQKTSLSSLVVEYLSDGYDQGCDDYEIDVRASNAMLAYIRWKNAVDQPKKFNISQVRELKTDFYREKRLCKMRMNPFVLNEMQDAIRCSQKLVAKS